MDNWHYDGSGAADGHSEPGPGDDVILYGDGEHAEDCACPGCAAGSDERMLKVMKARRRAGDALDEERARREKGRLLAEAMTRAEEAAAAAEDAQAQFREAKRRAERDIRNPALADAALLRDLRAARDAIEHAIRQQKAAITSTMGVPPAILAGAEDSEQARREGVIEMHGRQVRVSEIRPGVWAPLDDQPGEVPCAGCGYALIPGYYGGWHGRDGGSRCAQGTLHWPSGPAAATEKAGSCTCSGKGSRIALAHAPACPRRAELAAGYKAQKKGTARAEPAPPADTPESIRAAILEPWDALPESELPQPGDTPEGRCTRCHYGKAAVHGLCVYCSLADQEKRDLEHARLTALHQAAARGAAARRENAGRALVRGVAVTVRFALAWAALMTALWFLLSLIQHAGTMVLH